MLLGMIKNNCGEEFSNKYDLECIKETNTGQSLSHTIDNSNKTESIVDSKNVKTIEGCNFEQSYVMEIAISSNEYKKQDIKTDTDIENIQEKKGSD